MKTKSRGQGCSGELTHQTTAGPYSKENSPQKAMFREAAIPGELLTLTGYVFDTDCSPIPGAWLDFWHANGNGEYDNAGYKLRGHQYTDEAGKYRLETVVPVQYTGRTAHIHVKVRATASSPVLTTQLFIPGLSNNKTDAIYQDALLMDWKEAPNGKVAVFSFVVNR